MPDNLISSGQGGRPAPPGQAAAAQALVGTSAALNGLREQAAHIARSRLSPILITGESGTGKELLARYVHDCSARRAGPFVIVPCPGLADLDCDRLFGDDPADPGAPDRAVACRRAAGGTLLLDEIADLSLRGQAMLLPRLERAEPAVPAAGSAATTGPCPPRVIATTAHDLRRRVRDGRLREGLYWRLNVAGLECPPFRDRPEDVPVIADDFLRRQGLPPLTAAQAAMLMAHDWPGNGWELKTVLERAMVLADWRFAGLPGRPGLRDDNTRRSRVDNRERQ